LSCKDDVGGFIGGENLDGNLLGYDTMYLCRWGTCCFSLHGRRWM